jgi:hypothetical protein
MNTDFPEYLFEIDNNNLKNYEYMINLGSSIAKEKTILFCGIARDVGEVLELNLARVHRTGKMFKDYSIFIYENDSKDNTKDILNKHSSDKLTFLSESREDKDYRSKLDTAGDPWHHNRCTVLSECRNKYVEYILKLKNKPDYVCVIDWDLKGGWSYVGILHSIFLADRNNKYGCISGYGVLAEKTGKKPLEEYNPSQYIMYDSFAFRPLNASSKPIHLIKTPMFNGIVFTRDMGPIKVDSNFGGISIYKTKSFLDGEKYSAKNWVKNSGFVDPDHVNFNRNLLTKGWDIVLNPCLIASYSHHKYSKEKS